MNKIKIIGVVMKYDYEALSGNQELFKHNADGTVHTISLDENCNVLFWRSGVENVRGDIIAERKVTEKYIPKDGDVFRIVDKANDNGELLCLKSSDSGVAFEYLEGGSGVFNAVSTSFTFKFIRKHDDKAANPVNFTSEKYVPRPGDIFAVKGSLSFFKCSGFEQIMVFDTYNITIMADSTCGNHRDVRMKDCEFFLIHRPSTK